MAFHAHTAAPHFEHEQATHSRHWVLALFALSAASWALTIGAVRLLVAVL